MRKQWLTAGGVLVVIGCGVSSNQSSTSDQTEGAARAAAMRDVVRTHGKAIGGSTYRVVGGKDTPNFRVQLQNLMREHPASSGADWNVPTGAPVHATPGTYTNFSSAASTDQLAFATDATDATAASVGYVAGGAENDAEITGGTLTAAQGSSLLVFSDLYSTKPALLYYNGTNTKFAPFSYVDYSFPAYSATAKARIYALDASGDLWCFSSPNAAASSTTTPTALAACSNWGETNQADSGFAVTYGAPYPIYSSTTVANVANQGDVVRMYWADNKDRLNCLTLQEESASTAPEKCATLSGKSDYTSPQGTLAGPVAVNEITNWSNATKANTGVYTIYWGDQAGVFYEVEDNAGTFTLANAWCLPSNATYVHGTNCTSSTQGANSVVGAPLIFNPISGSASVFVASGTNLFQFPIPTSVPPAAWSSSTVNTAALNASQSAPIFGGPIADYNNNTIYVTTGGALYTVGFSTTISGTAAATKLFKVPTQSFYIDETAIAPASFPVGSAFTWGTSSASWVYTNSGYGGSTSLANTEEPAAPVAIASGGLEQYAGTTTTSALQFMQSTVSAAGTMASSGPTIDWEDGNVYFGYDKGWTSASTFKPGGGGIVQVALGAGGGTSPTTDWQCAAPFTASGANCNFSTTGAAGAPCRSSADCTASGTVCANEGSNPAYVCVTSSYCGVNGDCTAGTCDTTSSDSTYGTCSVCTSDSQCSGATPACNTATGKCVQCSPTNVTECDGTSTPVCIAHACAACTTNAQCTTDYPTSLPACNTTSGLCVECTAGHTAACTGAAAVCDTTTDVCVQCTSGNKTACTGTTPYCDTNSDRLADTCVACDTQHACTTGTCDLNSGDQAFDECSTCTSNANCSAPTPYCNNGSCVECVTNAECGAPTLPNGEGECNVNGNCVCFGADNSSDCPATTTCSVTTGAGQCTP